jgi:hypothetical protein
VWKQAILLTLVTSLAVGVPGSFAGSPHAALNGKITLHATEYLIQPHVTNGGVAGHGGHFSISGAIADKGKMTDYRTQKGSVALVRRVAVGKKGTITFLITIDLKTGSEPWTIRYGTKAYKGLQGKGTEVVDTWYTTPATFVMKGTVSQ